MAISARFSSQPRRARRRSTIIAKTVNINSNSYWIYSMNRYLDIEAMVDEEDDSEVGQDDIDRDIEGV